MGRGGRSFGSPGCGSVPSLPRAVGSVPSLPLGAGPVGTFFRVTLPLAAPGIAAGALLAFTISLDDYVVTSLVAGVDSGTLPIEVYQQLQNDPDAAVALSVVLLVVSVLVLVVLRGRWRVTR